MAGLEAEEEEEEEEDGFERLAVHWGAICPGCWQEKQTTFPDLYDERLGVEEEVEEEGVVD